MARSAAVAQGINRILNAAQEGSPEQAVAAACVAVAIEITQSEYGFIGEFSADGVLRETATSDPTWSACEYDRFGHRAPAGQFRLTELCEPILQDGKAFFTNSPAEIVNAGRVDQRQPPLTAFLGVPLLLRGRIIGMIGVANAPGGYDRERSESLELLVPSIVEALGRSHAEAAMEEANRLAQSLRAVETAIYSSLSVDVIAAQALEVGCAVLGADAAVVSRYESPVFRVLRSFGLDDDFEGREVREAEVPHRLLAVKSMKPVVVCDSRFDSRADADRLVSEDVLAVIVVPLIIGGEALGDIYYSFKAPRYLSDAEIDFVQRLAFSLSLAMHNALMFESERETMTALEETSVGLESWVQAEAAARQEAEVLHEIARLALSSLQPQELAQRAVSDLKERFGLSSCSLWLAEDASERLVRVAQVGLGPEPAAVKLRGRSRAVEAFRKRELVLVGDTQEAAKPTAQTRMADLTGDDARAYAIAPLIAGERSVGILVFVWPHERAFRSAEVTLIEGIANQLALGFENASLYVTERRRRRLNEALNRISGSLLSSETTDEVVQGVVREVVRAFGADKALVAVLDRGWWQVVSAEGFGGDVRGARYRGKDVRTWTLAARTRLPQLISDAISDSRAASRFNEAQGVASAIVLPLVVRGGVAAVVDCAFERHQEFDDEDARLAEEASLAISLGYETAVLLEERAKALSLTEHLQEMQTTLLSAESFDRAAEAILGEASRLIDASGAAIVLRTKDGWALETMHDPSGVLSGDAHAEELTTLLDTYWSERSLVSSTRAEGADRAGVALAQLSDPAEPAVLVFERATGSFAVPERDFVRRLAEGIGVAKREQRIRHEREWLSSSRQQWLSGISHDIRTPLASIRGYAELLADDYRTSPEEVRRQGSIIARQTERIQGLVDDLLLMFRVKEGALPMTLESLDLYCLLEEVAAATLADLHYDRGQLTILGARGEHFGIVDSNHFQRALRNLVTNAFVHNPPGTEVTVGLESRNGIEEVSVRDDGSGMDKDQLARIWTRYESGIDAGDDTGGVGLGMSVSRQLIESMGGSIAITSSPGEGTNVVIQLVAAEETQREEGPAE